MRPLHVALIAGLLPAAALATHGDQMTAMSAPQAGMAGATTAFAQDAVTVFANPAGLADLAMRDVRMDLGFGLLNPPRRVNGRESGTDWYLLPTGAVAFNVNERLFLGVGMGGVSGMGVNVKDVAPAPGDQVMVTSKQVFRFSPSAAWRVLDALAVGVSLNVAYQSLALANASFSLPQNQQYGLGATAGATWRIAPGLQAGVAWTSRTWVEEMSYNTSQGTVRLDMDMPSSLAVGVAWWPTPDLLLEADVKRIFFSDVMDRIEVDSPGAPYPSVLPFGWSDQTVYAIGVRKDLGATSLRLGLSHGESPIGPEDVDANLGSTAVVETHVALGVTRRFGEKVRGNVAYTRALHNEVRSSTTASTIEMEQNQLNVNVTYLF